MAFLEYISDEKLVREVFFLLEKARVAKEAAEKNFHKNVIDPFAMLIEASGYHRHDDWKTAEMGRQVQKTLQNHIGNFHQNILGHVENWDNQGVGADSGVDLVNNQLKVIAEIKNKHNTVTGGNLAAMYYSLLEPISAKVSRYKGYTAYFVNIIPKRRARFNVPFQPSDRSKGAICALNESVRHIDGASFYELVTGRRDALKELYFALPNVIEKIYHTDYNQQNFNLPDKDKFIEYFDMAYI